MGFFDALIGDPLRGLGIEPSGLPLAGPLLFENPAENAKLDAMRQMQAAYEQYRPEVYQARLNALRQSMGAFQPANQLLQQMYGTSVPLNFQDPFGPGGPPGLPGQPQQSGNFFEPLPQGVTPIQPGPQLGRY